MLRNPVTVLRLTPFDLATPEGRSKERYRRAALTAVGSFAGKGLSFLTLMISVPLTLHYLGSQRYGMWMTISSVITMLIFADLGIGNALLNLISDANGKEDCELARQLISTAVLIVSSISLLLCTLFTLVYPFIPWARFFNVTTPRAMAEAGPASAAFAACFFLGLPVNLAARVQLGYQDGVFNDLWSAAGSVAALAGILLVIDLRAGLPWLVVAYSGGRLSGGLLNGLTLFGIRRRGLRPRFRYASWNAAYLLFRLGGLFFILQLAMCLAFLSDNIVIAQCISANAVAQYAVPQKMFELISVVIALLLGPLWPAYGEAIARGDHAWVAKTLRRSLRGVVILAGAASLMGIVFGRELLRVWVGKDVAPPFLLLFGLGLWTVMSAAGNALATFLNGAGLIKFQIATAVTMALAALALKLILAPRMGPAGVIWGTNIAYALTTLFPCALLLPAFTSDKPRPGDRSGDIALRSSSI